MKVNSNNQNNISYKGFYNNKLIKKCLIFAADNGALFSAATILTLSTTVRPLSILITPKTDKENKKIACAKSLTSSLVGYGLMLMFSKPLTRSIKKIDNNPTKYLTKDVVSKYQDDKKNILDSKKYQLATEFLKLGLGFILAAPKAILTILTLPFVNQKIFSNTTTDTDLKKNSIAFKAKENFTKHFAKFLSKDSVYKLAKKYENSNFPLHITAASDVLTASTFIVSANKNKKIKNERKKSLIYNTAISTTLSLIATYGIEKLTKKSTENFIEKFKKANKNDPNLSKYIEGIKIAKPILLLGIIYYTIIPVISTFWADRVGQK